MSYNSGDRYGGGGGGGGGYVGQGGGHGRQGGEAGSYYQQGNQFDNGSGRRDDRRDDYGGGRDDYGRQGGGPPGNHSGNQGGFDQRQGGQGNYGRNDYDNRPTGGGGYGRNDYDERPPQGSSGGYGRNNYNDRPSGGQGGYDRHSGGQGRNEYDNRPSGGQGGYGGQEDRYGAPGKPYAGPQSGQDSTPYNAPSSGYDGPHRPGQSGGGGGYGGYDLDDDEVLGNAGKDEDKGFFKSALSFLKGKGNDDDKEDIDEGRIQQQHDNIYQGRPNEKQDSNSLGAAAAMHAFQMFNSGSGKQQSGGSQNKLLGMAFSEASSLFDKQNSSGNVASNTTKEGVIQAAGKYALKMYLKNGAGGGGSSGLLGMASKFL